MERKLLINVAVLIGLCAGGLLTGCLDLGYADNWDSYGGGGYTSYDETEDQLLVSGSGETLVLEYNTLTFPARLDWEDGSYYFSPDPDGTISGHKIICALSISNSDLQGDCFRDGHVCHFSYYEAWNSNESSDKDAYDLNTTSCKTAASVGPFLVPLEAPLCGEDPFPACPPDDLPPSGSPMKSPPADDEPTSPSPVDPLIQELCAAAARCDAALTDAGCLTAMDGEAGKQIWDDFGLARTENQRTTVEVKQGIADGSIVIDETTIDGCLHELLEACDSEGESYAVGGYENVENLMVEYGACSFVLSETPVITE